VIYQGRAGRGPAQTGRSQLAVRLGIAVYSALCAAITLRCIVLILYLPATVWSVGAILSASSPVVLPFSVVPAASRVVVGALTLSDLTATLLLLALPLALLGRQRHR
jgi:hypothetical protein